MTLSKTASSIAQSLILGKPAPATQVVVGMKPGETPAQARARMERVKAMAAKRA